MSATVETTTAVDLREAGPSDAAAIANVLFDAFAGIHDHHRFPRDFPTPEAARGLADAFTAHPGIWGVVAEGDGGIVGSNFLDQRGPIAGIGPITVDPRVQATGVGRRLMEAVIERGAGGAGIRLLQDAFNAGSMALYTSLGFVTREPIALLAGRPRPGAETGLEVRRLTAADLAEAAELHRRVHGFDRSAELRDALESPVLTPVAGVRDGRIVAYASGVTFFAASHGVAETEDDLLGLILGALERTDAAASLLLPTRQSVVFRGALAAGLRVVKPMTYMTLGDYREPEGAWFPTVLY